MRPAGVSGSRRTRVAPVGCVLRQQPGHLSGQDVAATASGPKWRHERERRAHAQRFVGRGIEVAAGGVANLHDRALR